LGEQKIATVHEQGWDSLEDGPLLTVAEKEFDVLLTIDGSIQFQQNLSKFQIGLIVVHVPKNQMAHYRVIQKELLAAIESRPQRSDPCPDAPGMNGGHDMVGPISVALEADKNRNRRVAPRR
jgi:hypothetical protein